MHLHQPTHRPSSQRPQGPKRSVAAVLVRTAARVLAGVLTAAAACTAQAAEPAAWPTRPVTVVVPFAAGGSTDLLARTVLRAMEKDGGRNFIVENVGGAGATLGTNRVANAAPDGYTLLLGGSSALVMAPHLFTNLRYDPLTSFEPIGKVATSPYVLLARRNAGLDSYEQLIAQGKQRPSKLNYGSPGVGSALHLTIELMLDGSGFAATHVPFTGTAPVYQALLSDTVDFMIDSPVGAVPMVKSGKANALAVTSRQRVPDLPQVPTLQEKGLKDFESLAWFAMLAPKGTPPAVVARLNAWLAAALADPDTRATLLKAGFEPADPDPAFLSAEIKRESARWGALIKSRNLKLNP